MSAMDELFRHIRLKRAACQFARSAFQRAYPSHPPSDAWVRAVETDRVVVAVFYEAEARERRPAPYKVFAVDRATCRAEEMRYEPDSRYWWHI